MEQIIIFEKDVYSMMCEIGAINHSLGRALLDFQHESNYWWNSREIQEETTLLNRCVECMNHEFGMLDQFLFETNFFFAAAGNNCATTCASSRACTDVQHNHNHGMSYSECNEP